MKPEQERLVTVLKDTISLLCKNSLSYEKQVVVQGLICVTVDKEDVLVVQVNDSLGEPTYDPCVACGHQKHKPPPPEKPSQSGDRRKRSRSSDYSEDASPSKMSRSTTKSSVQSPGRDTGEEFHGSLSRTETDLDDSSEMPTVQIKKEEQEEDDDEDLIMIDAEIKGENFSTSGVDYSDNDSSFNLPGTSADTPYITGFMDNSQITGISATPSGCQGMGQGPQGSTQTSWHVPSESPYTVIDTGQPVIFEENGLPKFGCSWPGCDKSFIRSQHIEDHMNVHKGVKPYSCPLHGCPYQGRSKNIVAKHIRSRHPEATQWYNTKTNPH